MKQYDENAEKYGYDGEMTPLKCDKLKVYVPQDGPYGLEPEEGGEPVEEETCCLKSEVDEAVAELKAAWRSEHEACEALKAKLESVQASAYADSVDAGMRERRLQRALWLARAERADDRARIFYFSDLESVLDIDGFSYDSKKKKGCKKLTARLWRIIWLEVERKCRAKAEDYK